MHIEISAGERSVRVEIPPRGRTGPVRIGDAEVPCDCVRLPDGSYSLILDGHVYDLSVAVDSDSCSVSGASGEYRVRLADPRRTAVGTRPEESQAGVQRIRADMPGKVIRILVKPGERVECDQGLLVLEAMKMQNEIRAPKGGIVRELGVRAGGTVGSGDFLVSLE